MVEVEARTVLWHLTFVGFAINYLVAINLNIAIVEMIAPSHTVETTSVSAQEYAGADSSAATTNTLVTLAKNLTQNSDAGSSDDVTLLGSSDYATSGAIPNAHQFQWNEHEQAMALGAFFWTHWLTQIPGGILAKKYGTKLIFGLSNVISCWICFLIPMAAKMDLYALIGLRLVQGLLTGLSWPAMHNMTAKWIPPNERSKFVTAYFGSSVGVAVFYPLYAYVMYFSSWQWTFHFSCAFGTIWWFAWQHCIFDTPAQHPRISTVELAHIEKSLGNVVHNSQEANTTPWKDILSSKSVWMNVIGQFAGVWGLFTLMTQSPTYFKVIHNWDIRATGIFSGLPHLLRALFAYVYSLFSDFLLRTKKMSRTNVRKLATALCCIVNGVFILALAFYGTNRILAITFMTLATMIQGSGSSGPLASMIDIAPNYAGIILGICGTIGCMPGFISTYIVGVLTLNNPTFEAWTNVFLICAAVLIGCGMVYVCFADSSLQPWNGHVAVEDNGNKIQLLGPGLEGDKNENEVEC